MGNESRLSESAAALARGPNRWVRAVDWFAGREAPAWRTLVLVAALVGAALLLCGLGGCGTPTQTDLKPVAVPVTAPPILAEPSRCWSFDGGSFSCVQVPAFPVLQGEQWVVASLPATTVQAQVVLGAPVHAGSRYYVYTDSSATIHLSDEPPSADLQWRQGGKDWHYLTNLLADSQGQVVPFIDAEHHYEYASPVEGGPVGDLAVLSAGSARSWAPVQVGTSIPPMATIARFEAVSSGAPGEYDLRSGSVTAVSWQGPSNSYVTSSATASFLMQSAVGQGSVEYRTTAGFLTLYVSGFDY